MSTKPPFSFNLRAFTTTILILLLGGFFCSMYLMLDAKNNPLSGKEITYTNTYNTASKVTIEGDVVYFSNCKAETTVFTWAEDTIILKTTSGAIGFRFKELSMRGTELICENKTGALFKFMRFTPTGLEPTKENEVLVIFTPSTKLALTANHECADPSQLPQE